MWKTFKRKKHHGDTRHEAYELQYKGETWIVKMRSFKTRVKRSMPYKKRINPCPTRLKTPPLRTTELFFVDAKIRHFLHTPKHFPSKLHIMEERIIIISIISIICTGLIQLIGIYLILCKIFGSTHRRI